MIPNSSINEIFDCPDINSFLQHIPSYKFINLTCIHINIRSTIKNFYHLEQIILSCNRSIDIIILTEVNISETICNLYNINGYEMHAELRKNRKGGGILIYVNKKHKFVRKKPSNNNHFECLLGNITTPSNYSATMCAVYRPPNNCKHLFIQELQRTIDNCEHNLDFFLLGDTNMDTKIDNPVKHKYISMLSSTGLECGISDYTRIELTKEKLSKTCIDHIYARTRTQDLFTAALGTVLADHRAIALVCTIQMSANIQVAPKQKVTYDHKKLSSMLENIDWAPCTQLNSPIKIYELIKNNINNCYDKCKKTIYIKQNSKRDCQWINKKAIKACEYKDKMYINWKTDSNNKILKLKYCKARNYANKIINKSKNTFFRRQINNNIQNPKQLWQILNTMTGRIKQSIDNIILNAFKKNNISPSIIANDFAKTFNQSVKDIVPKCNIPLLNNNNYRKSANVTLRFHKADADTVDKIIKSLSSDKAPGVDRIRAIDLKLLSKNISTVIAHLINTCVSTGRFPKELKTGIVRPIHKKGSYKTYENYRPITILPTIDKIIEKYICKQVYSFYGNNAILTESQYGFQPKKNTTQLLSNFTNSINKYLNDKLHVLVVFIDFSKAFDTLRHDILIDSLSDCGIRGALLDWCKDYLDDRSYCVKVGDAFSNDIEVKEGTAQGSVLGPLHYLTYVNNLANLIKSTEIYMFADDTCLLAADRDIHQALLRLQTDFNALNQWSHDVGLVLNANKTKLMYISSSQNRILQPLHLTAHNHVCLHNAKRDDNCSCPTIDTVSSHTYLGLVIDDRLSWKVHIDKVCDGLRALLAKLALVKNKIPYSIRLLLYQSLGESITSYGLSSYGRTFKTHLDQIYNLQVRLLKHVVSRKVILECEKNYHALFKHCKLLPIHDKIKCTMLLEEYFNFDLQIQASHSKHTRSVSKNILQIPRVNNLYGKRTLQYIVPSLINELPAELRTELNVKNIKRKLKSHFLNKTI